MYMYAVQCGPVTAAMRDARRPGAGCCRYAAPHASPGSAHEVLSECGNLHIYCTAEYKGSIRARWVV